MGLIGGGPGSFIGPVHRLAASMDGHISCVAGVFSSDPARSAAGGEALGVAPDRTYPDLDTMLSAELGREDGIDFITIATPNHTHLPIARAALQAGLSVISDKPATASLAEALDLQDTVKASGRSYALTYTYSGYPLVREARARVAAGEIGTVRKIVVEYSQGWLATAIERQGSKQASWRVDPARSGAGGCIGDIGVHAFHLAEFVSGLRVTELLADLASVVPGRPLDDDANLLLRFSNGARGVLIASQISVGELNGLRLRVYGDGGSLCWAQEQPNLLVQHEGDGGTRVIRAGDAQLSPAARAATRLPGGHPEGYLEAFANLYRDFAAVLTGEEAPLLPGIEEGVRSLRFVETAVEASRSGAGWTPLSLEDVA